MADDAARIAQLEAENAALREGEARAALRPTVRASDTRHGTLRPTAPLRDGARIARGLAGVL